MAVEREPFGGSISASVHFGGSNSACVHFGGSNSACVHFGGSWMLAVSAFGMCGLGSQQELILKGVQVVLVWKYSESEEEPRPPNITLRTARAYAASDRSWRPVRSSSSHIEPPSSMTTENTIGGRRLRWGLWGVSGLRGSASWFGGSSRRLHRRTEHTLSSVTVITSSHHRHTPIPHLAL